MNTINPGGLLWFDDDSRRSIQEKIAAAAQRYRERIGYEPTVCQLNPAQANALEIGADRAVARPKRAPGPTKPSVLPVSLRLVPNDLIQPHCYLISVGEGEEPRPATLPYRDDPEPDRAKVAQGAKASQSYRVSRAAAVKPVEQPIAPVAAKPIVHGVKKAATTTAIANKTASRATTAKQPVEAVPQTRAQTARTKVAHKREPGIEQPTLIALAPEPQGTVRQPASRQRVSRKSESGNTTAKATRIAKAETPATTVPSASAPARSLAAHRRASAAKASAIESPTLPMMEAPAPRARRARRHVA